jgi:two-component system cell cycle response regulator
VLLVEDDVGYARLMAELLAQPDSGGLFPPVDLVHVERLSLARTRLARHDIRLVLLDLTLPDSTGLGTLTSVVNEFPEVPVVVVTGQTDEGLALRALQRGAQDYLIKSEVDRRALLKSMRYSLERHRLQEQLRSLSLTDALTGLYNRRGFMTFAERQLKLVRRRKQGAIVLLTDMDGLKAINDRYGHAEGDRALVKVAEVLRASFRDEDIVGRLGGDEFAVVALDIPEDDKASILKRIESHLAARNARRDQPYVLTLSTGWARVEPRGPISLDKLLAEADEHLYRMKAAHATGAKRRTES